MPRKPRVSPPGVPCHLSLPARAHQPCFFTDEDYLFFLATLREVCRNAGVRCHAYVLMPAQVQLLLTPGQEDSLEQALRVLIARQARYGARRYGIEVPPLGQRTLVSLVEPGRYLLDCQRYIEMLPLRQGMAQHPADYLWSSYRAHAYGEPDPLLRDHPSFQAIHRDPEERRFRYRALFEQDLPESRLQEIERAVAKARPQGSEEFRDRLAQADALDVA